MNKICANCDEMVRQRLYNDREYLFCDSCKCWWLEEKLSLATRHRRPRPKSNILSLIYEPNGTNHSDLLLRLGSWATRCDTYYYELDHPTGTRPDIVQSILALLQQWKKYVENMPPKDTVYLPYDFSDQYSGWLKLSSSCSNEIYITDGYCTLEGWAFYPSDYEEAIERINDYEVYEECPDYNVPHPDIIKDINASIKCIEKLR